LATDLVLIRHGETTLNAERRMAGWTDSPLAEKGFAQAAYLGAHVSGRYTFDRLYCSPLIRTVQTASSFAGALGLEPVLLDDLREMYFGEYEGLTISEIAARTPLAGELTGSLLDHFDQWPGGESIDGFVLRVRKVTRRMIEESPDQRIAVVTHGAVIGSIFSDINGGAPNWRKFVPRNCSISEVRADNGVLTAVSHDDTSFILDVDPTRRW
jgi:broad specificity phosphatase PhoE